MRWQIDRLLDEIAHTDVKRAGDNRESDDRDILLPSLDFAQITLPKMKLGRVDPGHKLVLAQPLRGTDARDVLTDKGGDIHEAPKIALALALAYVLKLISRDLYDAARVAIGLHGG